MAYVHLVDYMVSRIVFVAVVSLALLLLQLYVFKNITHNPPLSRRCFSFCVHCCLHRSRNVYEL